MCDFIRRQIAMREAGPVLLTIVLLALAACTKPMSKTWAYNCADGYTFNITYSDPENIGDIAVLEDASGATKLPRAVSASGEKYSNGATTFWSKGEEAMIMVAGIALSNSDSARSFFSLAFSVSSALSFLASETSMPPYFDRHL